MTWHRGLREQTWWPWGGSGRSRHWYGVRCDMAPRQGDGRSGRRCDTSGVDQSSHTLRVLGRHSHSSLYLLQ